MIVVTGATGHVGGLVAQRTGAARRADAARRPHSRRPRRSTAPRSSTPTTATRTRSPGPCTRATASSWSRCTEGPDERLRLHRSFIEAATRATGVGYVVYLSFVAAGPDAIFLHARSHGATEQMLRDAGCRSRPSATACTPTTSPAGSTREGVDRAPGGDGRMSFSYRPELADVIATALAEPGHEGKVYDITTPEAVTPGRAGGDRLRRHRRRLPVRARGRRLVGGALAREGKADWGIEAGLTSYEALRRGEFDVVTNDYRAVTGRDPLTDRADHRAPRGPRCHWPDAGRPV